MTRLWVLLSLLLLAVQPAAAETRSLAYSNWSVAGGDVNVRYIFPTAEAKALAAAGAPVLTTKQVADYVLAHLSVTRQGKICPPVDQGQDVGLINTLALTPGYLRFEIIFGCDDEKGLTLSDTAFFDRVNNHVDYARVQIDNGSFVQHVFTAAAPHWMLPAGPLRNDSILRYAGLGLSHVLHSAEILCFLLALVLLARQRRDYLLALAGLAAGYGLAALLATYALTAPRFASGQAFSGLLLFLTAAAGVALSLPDPRRGALLLCGGAAVLAALPLLLHHDAVLSLAVIGTALPAVSALFAPRRQDQRAMLLLIATFLFALLDGFILSDDLAILSLPAAQLAPMLAGFNAGVLLAEMALPLCLAAAWFALPMVRRLTAPTAFLPDLAASVFIGCGIFWFASQLPG